MAQSGVCAHDLNSDCVNALSEILQGDQNYDLVSRVAGIDMLIGPGAKLAPVVVGVAAWLLAKKPEAVHLESTDIVQLQSQTASSIIFETSSGASAITVVITPSPTPTVSATITTLTADINGHHSGDVIITLPTQFAQPLGDLLGIAGGFDRCRNTTNTSKRGDGQLPNYDAINDMALWVLPMAGQGRAMNAFGLEAAVQVPRLQGIYIPVCVHKNDFTDILQVQSIRHLLQQSRRPH